MLLTCPDPAFQRPGGEIGKHSGFGRRRWYSTFPVRIWAGALFMKLNN